jgi:hypothetical protein
MKNTGGTFHREGAKKRKEKTELNLLRVSSRLRGETHLPLHFFHNS